MKGSGKWVLGVWTAAIFLLLYVHLNVSLFSLSYQINDRSKQVSKRDETYRYLKYEVERLKAPYRLSEKIQEHRLELDIPKNIRVIQMPMPEAIEPKVIHEVVSPAASKGLTGLLGRWVQIAQAKTE